MTAKPVRKPAIPSVVVDYWKCLDRAKAARIKGNLTRALHWDRQATAYYNVMTAKAQRLAFSRDELTNADPTK